MKYLTIRIKSFLMLTTTTGNCFYFYSQILISIVHSLIVFNRTYCVYSFLYTKNYVFMKYFYMIFKLNKLY